MLFLLIITMAIGLISLEVWHKKVAADDEKIYRATMAELEMRRAIEREASLMLACDYYTGSSYLKCTVNPLCKCTECTDFKESK